MRRRLPRKVEIGPYRIDVVLATMATIRDVMDDEDGGVYDGCWEHVDGDELRGRIYIHQKLTLSKKWVTFWHELRHAVTDFEGWDRQTWEMP